MSRRNTSASASRALSSSAAAAGVNEALPSAKPPLAPLSFLGKPPSGLTPDTD